MSDPKTVEVTVGACPYCGHNSMDEVTITRPHPTRQVMKCIVCDRYSTRQRGKYYPHDEPTNPESSIATRVRVVLD